MGGATKKPICAGVSTRWGDDLGGTRLAEVHETRESLTSVVGRSLHLMVGVCFLWYDAALLSGEMPFQRRLRG